MFSKKMKKEYIVFVLILIVAMGGSFYGGIKYQESKGSSRFAQMQRGQMNNGQIEQANRQKGGLVGGEILTMDEKSIVLKDRSGGSKIVFLSQSTQFLKSAEGALSDISVGSKVTVTGDQNPDGSVTAKIIQISSGIAAPFQNQNGGSTPVQNEPVK